jgi:N-acetyl-alpha-D-muramate 1-phosphate uridylyltransferase
MRHAPTALMLFAAGFGTRMGALTAERPKPMIPVAGRPLIDHAMQVAQDAGVVRVVVNVHYHGDQIVRHLAGRALVSDETARILDTGGGLRAALPMLGPGPLFTLNSDAVWTGNNPLVQLAATWDPARMEGLLLLLPVDQAAPASGRSDFVMAEDGRLARAGAATGMVYLGAQIIMADGLAEIAEDVFSLNRLWDGMMARGTLFGLVHRGGWCDVGHPAGIGRAEAMLAGA